MTATKQDEFVFFAGDEPQIVHETAKAYQVQIWFGASSDPDESARCYWIPKSQSRECETANGVRFIPSAPLWWVSQNKLWDTGHRSRT